MKKPLALVALLLLGACVPDTAPQIKPIEPSALGLGTALAPRLPSDWWKAFGDPQADRLAAAVIAGNPSLQSAMARIRAAKAQIAVQNAGELPKLDLDGEEQRQLFSKDFIYPPPYAGSWRWFGSVEANFDWSLDFWGKQAALIAAAKANSQAAVLDEAGARLALSGAFAQSYINLYLAWQTIDIAAEAVAEREEILALTQRRFNSGLENTANLEQAKAQLAASRLYKLRSEAERDMLVHAIVALTGKGAADYAAIARPAPHLDTALPVPKALPADLLSRRPDILAAQARIEAAGQGRAAAKADFYPNIDLKAFLGFQAIGLSNLISGDSFTTGAGPAVHLPLFDAGKLNAQYEGATAAVDEAVAAYNGAVVNAVKQSADALTQVNSLAAQREQLQAALTASEKSYAYAKTRYQSGLSTQITLLSAQSNLLLIRQQAATLIAQEAAQRITLLLSVGGSFDPQSIDIAAKDSTP